MTSLPPSHGRSRRRSDDDLASLRSSTARLLFRQLEPTRPVLAIGADHGVSGSPVIDVHGEVVGQLYARLEEGCCVTMPIVDVVAAARTAEAVAVCR